MSTEANKAIIRRIYQEAESQGLLAVIDEVYASTFVDTRHPERGAGPASVKAHITEMRTRFPDLTVTVEHLVAEGDWVVARLTSRGTHRGAFAGIAPTGKTAMWEGMVMQRLVDGRVVEQRAKFDMFGLLQQLGAFPARPATPPA